MQSHSWSDVCRPGHFSYTHLTRPTNSPVVGWAGVVDLRDMEYQADLLGGTDIGNVPTLLWGRHGQPCFFGPILPHAATVARLIESCGSGGAAVNLPSGLLEGVSRWMTRHEAPAG